VKIYLAGEFGGGKQREIISIKLDIKRLYSYFYRDAGLDFILSKFKRSNHDSRTASFKIQTK
jgi:hypothetical protein